MPEMFDTSTVREVCLNRNLGRRVLWLDKVPSTNDIARFMAIQGEPQGTVVVADQQLRGRGRRGRAWHSSPGTGLLFSMILRPAIDPARLHLLTVVLALSLVGVLGKLGVDAKTKWPNDVLVLGRKISGILGESGGDPLWIVLGMGVNVDRPLQGIPRELSERCIFMSDVIGDSVDRLTLLQSLLTEMEEWYAIIADEPEVILEKWRRADMFLGKRVCLYGPFGRMEGTDEGIDLNGSLVLRTDSHSLVRVVSGEITLKPHYDGALPTKGT